MGRMAMVHIIGAGISGLSAATKLAQAHVPVTLYEATSHAGGRARSSTDEALETIDHGLHLIHGHAPQLRAYLTRIEADDQLVRIPSPIRPPAAPLADYVEALHAVTQPRGTVDAGLDEDNLLASQWLPRLATALFHTPITALSAAATRQACGRMLRHPRAAMQCYAPKQSLNESFIAPALAHLEYCGASVYYSHALTALQRSGDTISGLTFARKKIALDAEDVLILATPAAVTQAMLPQLNIPTQTHSSITIHYACTHREKVGSYATPTTMACDVVRYGEGRISLMLRVADGQWHSDPELLAHRLWRALQAQHPYLRAQAMPAFAIWREKRAGHVLNETRAMDITALPPRVLLAGDWLNLHDPASLEAAAASGHSAADAALAMLPRARSREQSAATRFAR